MNVREWALPVYTILIQLAVGALFFLWIIRAIINIKDSEHKLDEMFKIPVLIIYFTIIAGMIGAHFHLSKPYLSFLAILNFPHSWLSCEIVFTVIFFLLVSILLLQLWFMENRNAIREIIGWSSILAGFVTIYCMGRIYMIPTQIAWNSLITIPLYYVTAFLLGSTSLATILLMNLKFLEAHKIRSLNTYTRIITKAFIGLTAIIVFTTTLIIVLNVSQVMELRSQGNPAAQASLDLLLKLYRPLLFLRYSFLLLGVGMFVIFIIKNYNNLLKSIGNIYIASMLILIAEVLERFLFYATHVRIGV